MSKEKSKKTVPICPKILDFGYCSKSRKCKDRHIFFDSDRPVNIPIDGLVKSELAGVHNAAHYIIKIREYLPQGQKRWISCEKKNKKIEKTLEAMQTALKEEKQVNLAEAKPGDIFAVFHSKSNKWCRGKVIKTQ